MAQSTGHTQVGALTDDEASLTDVVYVMSRVRSFK